MSKEEKEIAIQKRTERLEIISKIPIIKSNIEYIAESGAINGSLMLSIEKTMKSYAEHEIAQLREALRELIPLAERGMNALTALVSERESITKAKTLIE